VVVISGTGDQGDTTIGRLGQRNLKFEIMVHGLILHLDLLQTTILSAFFMEVNLKNLNLTFE
jgi:hypothetical protein